MSSPMQSQGGTPDSQDGAAAKSAASSKAALPRYTDHLERDGWQRMGDSGQPVASTSRVIQAPTSISSLTLQDFRSKDRNREARLTQLYETLRQKQWQPVESAGATSSKDVSKDGRASQKQAQTPEEKRRRAVRRAYLQELYNHITDDGDPDSQSSGVPSYARFTRFIEEKEEALWRLFCSIDSDNDMQLSLDEIQHSLNKADIRISRERLADMVAEMDKDGSGHVTFDEWRDFLLLLPRPCSMSNVYTYWQSFSSPRLASSIATQDLDVLLAERPANSKSSPSPASAVSKGKQRAAQLEEHGQDGDAGTGSSMSTERKTGNAKSEKGIFEGSGVYLLAGGIAGAVSRTATAPFDRLKVFLINVTDRSGVRLPSASTTAHHPLQAAKVLAHSGNKGMGALFKAVSSLYTEGGFRAFFVGNGLNVIKIFPESAIKFWSYEYSKRWFARNVDRCNVADISGSSRFIAGGIGGVSSQLLIYPLETWKTRVMSSTSSAPGALKGNALYVETAKQMYIKGGMRSYWAGLIPALLGVFPYSAIDMSLFAAFKKAYCQYTGDAETGPMASLSFGALSGGLGATSVYPLNLVRTRMQTQGTKAHPQRYTGWKDVVTTCFRNEGIRGFYKGLMPTLLKVSPSMGISWVVYESTTALIFKQSESAQSNDVKEG